MQRALHIMSRLLDVATAVIARDDIEMSSVAACDAFADTLRNSYQEFLRGIHSKCHAQLLEDVRSFTEVLDCWGLSEQEIGSGVAEQISRALAHLEAADVQQAMTVLRQLQESGSNVPTSDSERDATRARVLHIMSMHDSQACVFPAAGRQVDDKTYRAFLGLCRKLFDRIRFKVVELVRNKLSTSILKPMFETMRETVVARLRSIAPEEFKHMFEAGSATLAKERDALQRKLAYSTALRDQFRAAANKFQERTTEP
jgi:hypothetical protein